MSCHKFERQLLCKKVRKAHQVVEIYGNLIAARGLIMQMMLSRVEMMMACGAIQIRGYET